VNAADGTRPRRAAGVAAALLLLLAVLGVAGLRAPPSAAAATPPEVAAWSGVVMDRVTGRILWSKDAHRRLQPASCTKIMTLLVVLEQVGADHLDDYLVVPAAVAGKSGIGLSPGDQITYRQAILGLTVRSATDCGIALAWAAAGDESSFVRLMNRKAADMGLDDTRFRNATGAPDDPRHVSSAFDLAVLGRAALSDPVARTMVNHAEADVSWPPDHTYHAVSGNWIVRDYAWADGVKSGYTGTAKYCIVASGTPGLRPLISVTMHEPSRTRNIADSLALLRFGSALYHRRAIVHRGDVVARRTLADGTVLVAVAGDDLVRVVVRRAARVTHRLSLTGTFPTAPPAGAEIGSVKFRADGVSLGAVRLFARRVPADAP
jgi:serine-type D-Ala-D-Ala carboxypeptidase (penicillin-binding protein 5/6)